MTAPSFFTARRKGAKVVFTGERKMSKEDKPVKEHLNSEDEASLKEILSRYRANGLEVDEQFLRSQINSEVLDNLEGKTEMNISSGDMNQEQENATAQQPSSKTNQDVLMEPKEEASAAAKGSESKIDDSNSAGPKAETKAGGPATYEEIKAASVERIELIVRTIDTVFEASEEKPAALPTLSLTDVLVVRGVVSDQLVTGIDTPMLKGAIANYPESSVEKFITSAMDIIHHASSKDSAVAHLTTHCKGLLIDLLDVDVDCSDLFDKDVEIVKTARQIFGVEQYYGEMAAA